MANAKRDELAGLDRRLQIEQKRFDLDRLRLQRKIVKGQVQALSTLQAADKSRVNHDWPARKKSADQIVIPDMPTINARARMALWDDGKMRSVVHGYGRHVVGIGITPRSAAQDPETGEPLGEFNEGIDRYWRRWARNRRWCDVAHRLTFVEAERLAISEWVLVGNAFARISYEPHPQVPGVRFQFFEAEQLDRTKTKNPDNGREVRGGVEIDEYGAAVAYWVHIAAHPQEKWGGKSARIPAAEVIHLHRPERVGQTLGISQLCASLQKSRHLSQYDVYQLIAARVEAAACGFYRRSPTAGTGYDDYMSLPLASGEEANDAHGARQIEMEPGVMVPLPWDAEEPKFFTPNRPGGQYQAFNQSQTDQIGAAAGLDGSTVARDYSRGNFSSQRQARLDVWDTCDPIQLMVIDELGRPLRELFKTIAVMEGRVEAPGFFEDPAMREAYLEDNWQGPPKRWVDPLKMAMAWKVLIDYRLGTRGMAANEQGLAIEDILREFGGEIREAEEQGVPLPDVQAQASAPATPATPEEPVDEDSEGPPNGREGMSAGAFQAALEREIEREVIAELLGAGV